MKFLQFTHPNSDEIRVGYLSGDNVVDINKEDPSLSSTFLKLLQKGQTGKVQTIRPKHLIPLSSVTLKAPIHGMDKVLCVGLNYNDHCIERKVDPPKSPLIFNKFPSTIVGPKDAVRIKTDVSQAISFEVELTVVIGKNASRVPASEAYDYVFGYTVAQDITASDWEKNPNMGQLILGKAMDTFCPIGPWIVTAEEVGDPQSLNIKCSVNGVEKQNSNTEQMIHKIPDIISRISKITTLLPGDILLTGTPAGVGINKNPPEYLQLGDVIRSEIQKIGVFETVVENFCGCVSNNSNITLGANKYI